MKPRGAWAHLVALHLVGLGLYDVKDITVKGLERARAADHVYAEFYTAMLAGAAPGELESFLGRKVQVLDRLGVERGGDRLVEQARTQEVVLLTAGDPMAATTHADLVLRARQQGVGVRIVHAPSITSAAPGLLGLQHYKFGRTTTLVRPERGWAPTSPFSALAENHGRGLHTLVLLDIKSDEGYYMRANEGLRILLDLAERTGNGWFSASTQVGVVARAGSDEPHVATGAVGVLLEADFGPPLHCIVVPGELQVVEQEAWDSLAQAGPSGSS
ncbi:MAG TPA: diphthine synthase [Candidatus Thermoplasmatota archaeon]|nr:diphthine synthase [Candidatus Thermoplasmatota archaeon]